MINGGKNKYICLLSLIKHESPDLYNAINDLCLDGMFRSQRFKTTFLMPNSSVVSQIQSLIDDDKDVQAIDAIRSLMLKDHLAIGDFKKDARISTLQYKPHVLADPESVGKQLNKYEKVLITTKEGAAVNVIYKYSGKDIPKTSPSESMKGGSIPLVGSGQPMKCDPSQEIICKITLELFNERAEDASKTFDNFTKAVNGVLSILQSSNDDRFDRAKFYLADNPILSWFFLTMPGRSDSLIKAQELEDFEWRSASSDHQLIQLANSAHYDSSVCNSLLQKIKYHRTNLTKNEGDKSSLIPLLHDVYKSMNETMLSSGAIDKTLHDHINLKKLMDELRFLYEKDCDSWDDVDTAIKSLGSVKWTHPEKSFVIFDQSVYGGLRDVSSFVSGPVGFVKSVYMLYVPLSEECKQKLQDSVSGGAQGDIHPSTINRVIFHGGAARKKMKAASDLKLSSLVKVLSKDQKESLRKMLG